MATSTLMKRNGRILDPLIEGFNTGQVANSAWVGRGLFRRFGSQTLRGLAGWNWRKMREISLWASFGFPAKGGLVPCQSHLIVFYGLCWVFYPNGSRYRVHSG